MKKKLSMLMVALVAIAAFATTMSLTNARRTADPGTLTWDFSDITFKSDVDEAPYTSPYDYKGLECVMTYNKGKDYITSGGFHTNGTSSTSNRHMTYTPASNGKLTVTFRSNNSSANDRITAIGTAVATFNKDNVNAGTVPATVLAYTFTEGSTSKTVEADLTADTKYYIYCANGGQTITKVEFVPSSDPEPSVGEKTWKVANSIAVNDVVLFAYADKDVKKEFKAIELAGSNSIGAVVDYEGDKPAGVFPLTVVAGSAEGSVAFKTSDNKYLAWSSGNTLTAADELNANSSWTVAFAGSVPTIANVADGTRKLQYNSGNPRFCAYTSTQKAITIWKQVEDSPEGETKQVTAVWDWKNGAPAGIGDVHIEGSTGKVASTVDGIEMTVDATSGKLKGNGDNVQFNTGTKLQVPVKSVEDVVTVVAHPYNFVNIKVGGETSTELTTTHTATADEVTAGYVEIESTESPYLYTVQVVLNVPDVQIATPVITGAEKFAGKQSISIACETEGAKVYYTTDGTDPTAESTEYTAPFEIEATTTVKAIAMKTVDNLSYSSEVASATFTAVDAKATIAELNALEDKAEFAYTGEALIVAQGVAGKYAYTYIKDETASALIFDNGGTKVPADAVGKKLAKDWMGSVTVYHGLKELVPAAALTLAEGEKVAVDYPVVDFSYITADHANEAVMLSGVSYQFVNEEELNITKGESQLAAVNKFGLNPGFAKKGVEYNIIGVINVDNDKVAFWPVEFVEKPTMNIDVKPAADSDISEAVAEASEGIFVQDITITLEADKAYTMSAPIAAPANLTIIGAAGATIDASAVSGPLFQYAAPATPAAAPRRAPATPVSGYTYIDNVSIKDVTITGVKGSIYWDGNQKVCIENFSIENAEIALETESGSLKDNSIISFQGGSAKDFTIKNSTIYGNAVAKYFNKASGNDFKKAGYTEATVTYENNTFYNVLNAEGQWGNNLRYNNNFASITLAINGNIWYECGNGEILRRLLNKNFKDFKAGSTMANNTFWSADKPVDQGNYGNGSDLTTNPYFQGLWKELAEGELFFAVDEVSAQATNKTGDQRWGTWAPKHYTITVSEEAKQFADFTVLASALDGETVKVEVKEKNGFQLKELIAKVGAQTKLTVTDNSFVMPPANVTIDATFDKIAADYELAPAAGTDIAAALEGLIIRNLKLTLAEGGAYTLTKSIEFSGDLDIVGKGATIDASTLETPFISLSATPAVKPIVDSKTDETTGETTETIKSYPIGSINIHDVTVKGLSQQLVKSNNLYLVNSLTVENAVVEIKGAVKKSIFDFSGANGNVIALIVNNSTLYADAETQWANGGFFSNQSGKKHSELGVDTEAEGFEVVTAIMNSTLYNISGGKTTSTLRENSKPFMKYAVKNSIIVNSGKKDQFLKGLNSGQAGNDANWDVDGNLFNFDGAMAKEAVNNAENIKNTVEGVITFADAAAGVFNYTYVKDPRIAEWPAIGDKRWTATAGATAYAINVDEAIVNGTVTPSATWSAADETIKLTVKPDEGYELASLVVMLGKTELELGEDNSFLMPAADVNVTATFVAVPKLYIIGGPKEWKLDDMTEMKYNLETQTYEFEYAPAGTAYFAFADKQFTADEAAAEGAWDVFNANNRIALGADNVDAVINGEPAQLQKVNGTIVLKAGTYKISVTKDLKMTITGEVAPDPTVEKLYIMGTATPKGWDGTTEMTFNETSQAFEYELESADKIYITFGDAEWTNWDDFNANNRLAIAGGDNNAPVGEEFKLIKVNGTLVLEAGAYKISVTKDLKCIIKSVPSGINGVKAEALDNAVIYNLQGVRVEKSQAKGGVFIVNGRKMHLK